MEIEAPRRVDSQKQAPRPAERREAQEAQRARREDSPPPRRSEPETSERRDGKKLLATA